MDKSISSKAKNFFKNPYLVISLFFFISRMGFYLLGVRFDYSPIVYFWQILDIELLRHNLSESLFFLHSQPPLFNLFLGTILKLFPHNEVFVFNIIYFLLGLSFSLGFYYLLKKIEITPKIRMFLCVVLIISPSMILYENWLFYSYPLAVLFCFASVTLFKFLEQKRLFFGVIFFSILATMVLIRSVFHLGWFILIFLFLFIYLKKERKKILKAFLIPFFIILVLYSKNFLLFGSFASSSWLGMNFSGLTTFRLSEEDRQLWVNQGKITSYAMIPSYSPISRYGIETPPTGKTVLDSEFKKNGDINLNHINYIQVSKTYMEDAILVISERPELLLNSLCFSNICFFQSSSDNYFLSENKTKIGPWVKFYDSVFLLRLKFGHELEDKNDPLYFKQEFLNMGFFLLFFLPLLTFYSLKRGLTFLWRKKGSEAKELTLLFISFNLVYVPLICNLFSLGENNRFRFMLFPLYIVLFGIFLDNFVGWAKRKWQGN